MAGIKPAIHNELGGPTGPQWSSTTVSQVMYTFNSTWSVSQGRRPAR